MEVEGHTEMKNSKKNLKAKDGRGRKGKKFKWDERDLLECNKCPF